MNVAKGSEGRLREANHPAGGDVPAQPTRRRGRQGQGRGAAGDAHGGPSRSPMPPCQAEHPSLPSRSPACAWLAACVGAMHACVMAGAPRVAASLGPAVYSSQQAPTTLGGHAQRSQRTVRHAAPVQASRRAALAQLLGAGMLLAGGPANASFNETAAAKAAARAQLLEETRARAEGRAPRQIAPAASAAEEAAQPGRAAPAKVPAKAEPASSFNDAAVQRQSAKAALLAEARQKALAAGASKK